MLLRFSAVLKALVTAFCPRAGPFFRFFFLADALARGGSADAPARGEEVLVRGSLPRSPSARDGTNGSSTLVALPDGSTRSTSAACAGPAAHSVAATTAGARRLHRDRVISNPNLGKAPKLRAGRWGPTVRHSGL